MYIYINILHMKMHFSKTNLAHRKVFSVTFGHKSLLCELWLCGAALLIKGPVIKSALVLKSSEFCH